MRAVREWSIVVGMRKMMMLGLVLAACSNAEEEGKRAALKEAPPEELETNKELPPPPPKRKEMPKDLGSCKLAVTGAVEVEQVTPGGREATNVSYWYKPEERKNMMGVDGFVVNCKGPRIKLQIHPGGASKDGMPFAPKKYELGPKAPKEAGVSVMIDKSALTKIEGTIDITAFDARHIEGTIDLAGKLDPGKGSVKLTGSFDLICPGLSACEY